jgi:hypothetical protein
VKEFAVLQPVSVRRKSLIVEQISTADRGADRSPVAMA